MTERWDGGSDAGRWTGDGRGGAGWVPGEGTPLRRHGQPRQPRSGQGLGTWPERPAGVGDEDPFAGPSGDGAGTGRGPGNVRTVPNGRRPDPSSLDPALTTMRTPLAGPDPSWAPSTGPAPDLPGVPPAAPRGTDAPAPTATAFPGVGRLDDEADLQPGTRLRVGPRHGAHGRRERREQRPPKSPLRAAIGAGSEVVVVLGMALLLSLLIKTFLVQAFFIPSQSMENTLLVGDRVLVSKLTPGVFQLHRGDIVVFKDPGGWLEAEQGVPPDEQGGVGTTLRNALAFVGLLPQDSGEHLIKRVIGLGGDHVVCCDTNGRITVNGVAIDETPYLMPGAAPSDKSFNVTVPYGYLWVMGDNRPVSADSRLHRTLNNGMVPVHDVVGKAFVVVWPFDRAGGLGVPGQVFAKVPDPAATR